MARKLGAKVKPPAKQAPEDQDAKFPIIDAASGKKFYRFDDGSWLECDPIANQLGMYCHEVADGEVPQNIKNRAK